MERSEYPPPPVYLLSHTSLSNLFFLFLLCSSSFLTWDGRLLFCFLPLGADLLLKA